MRRNTLYTLLGILVIAAGLSIGVAWSQQPLSEHQPPHQGQPQGSHEIPHGWLLAMGAVFLVLYTWEQFNVPDRNAVTAPEEPLEWPTHNRCSTTAFRYYSAAAFYCLWGLALYLLLTTWPTLWEQVDGLHSPLGLARFRRGWLRMPRRPCWSH